MKKLLTLGVSVMALSLAMPAFAATKADKQMCDTLTKQVDDAIAGHATAPKLEQAKKMRAKGAEECTAGKFDAGVQYFHAAMRDLGGKSTTK